MAQKKGGGAGQNQSSIIKGGEELAATNKRLDLRCMQVDADGGLANHSAGCPPAPLAAVNGLTNPGSDFRDNRARTGKNRIWRILTECVE